MRAAKAVQFPRKLSKEIKSIPMPVIEEIRRKLEDMPGWEGSVARFMLAMYPYSGLRRSELRLARLQDLDTDSWRILVEHPKGKGKYAAPGKAAPILPPARDAVLRFLDERREYLAANGVAECEALIPCITTSGEVGYWTDGMWGKVKQDAQRRCGIPFCLQMMRRSFGQISKDRGASIEAVSRALRHRTTKTTEMYYARIRPEKAFKELEDVFSDYDWSGKGPRTKYA